MQLNVNLHIILQHVFIQLNIISYSYISDSYVSTGIHIYNILYLDSPHFPGSWPTIVLFTVDLTEAHLGAVQIQSCANLFSLFSSVTLHSFTCTYVPVDGDVKYLSTLCCLGTMQFSRWAITAQTPIYANLHTKQPRMFSI